MSDDRRLIFLHGKVASLEAEIATLEAENLALDEQLVSLNHMSRSLLEDRLWSAIRHRKSRIPIVIGHIQNEIRIVQADIDRYYTIH